jgi:2-polyprenyl-6-methoxyphenol hydroxylase-like FAD-dependent oxidoreductase
MASVDRVLIVGAGVAGLTAACALAGRGVTVEVAEATGGEPVGAAIMISGRALEALGSIGVMGRFRAEGILNPLGDRLMGGAIRESIAHYRPVLADILLQRAMALGATVRTSLALQGLEPLAEGVEAQFSDGTSGRYDLVIGADGIRSTVRELVFGPSIRPLYAGQCNIRWMTPGPPIGLPGGAFHGGFGKLLSYPLPQDLIYGISVFARPQPGRVTMEEARDLLHEQLSTMDEPYVRALHARLTPDIELIYRPFEWLMVPPPWHKGRVVLIGDAAHATTAHMSSGGGMAIEDAVVLGEELAGHENVGQALQAFTDRRLARVRMVVETSVALSKLEQEGAGPAEVLARGAPAYAALAEPY